MPIGWLSFSTASTPAARECRTDPVQCEQTLKNDLSRCGAELVGRLLFDVDKSVARALVRDLDKDPICRKGVLEKWGARYLKSLEPEEAAQAFGITRELGGSSATAAE